MHGGSNRETYITICKTDSQLSHTAQETQEPLVAQMVKSLPAVWETWAQSLCQEDPLEKEMAAHSSILAWRIPQTEEPDGLLSMGYQRVRHN